METKDKWREIAEQIVTEEDPERVLELTQELNEELERQEAARKPKK